MLNQENIRTQIIQCRRNGFKFFVMEAYFETNDGAIEFWRIKDDLQTHLLYCHHWSDEVEEQLGRRRRTKEKISVLFQIFQEQFFSSELFKFIQDAALLTLHYKTMSLFRTVSSSTFITSDVQSIYIPSSIQD